MSQREVRTPITRPVVELALTELTPAERQRLARRHPEIRKDRAAWVVSSEALDRFGTLLRAAIRTEAGFDRAVEALIPHDRVPSPPIVLQARRNAAARDALIREFGLLTSAEVAELAGSTARNRAALANRWKGEGRIFSVPMRGVHLWPGFQFDEEGKALPAVAQVLAVFPEEASAWEKALWFVSANGWLGGKRPVDLLVEDPQAVTEAARHEAEELVF